MVAGLEEITGGEIDIGGRIVNQLEPSRARHRDGVPELRAVPAHERVRQHGLRPEDRQGAAWPRSRRAWTRRPRSWSWARCWSASRASCPAASASAWPWAAPSCASPPVFLFDEPLSNLDAKLRAQTRLEIQKLHRELGITSLFVTHDQVEAMTLAQRMIVMNAGRMEQFGTPEEVYQRPATTFVAGFIGSPADEPAARPGRRLALHASAARRCRCRRAAPRNGELILGLRPEHASWGAAGGGTWELQVDVVETLGAERLVYCRLGETLFTVRIDGMLPPPRPGDRVPLGVAARATALVRRRHRPAGRMNAALALSAVDRPPRRRQAGAGEHAGRLPPRRELRLPGLRVRRQAQRRRRALPAARRRRCSAPPAEPAWPASAAGPSCRAGRRQLAQPRCYAGEPLPSLQAVAAFVQRNGFALDLEIKPTPGTEAHTGARGGRRGGATVARPRGAATAQLLPARGPARRARERARAAARAAARHAVPDDAIEQAQALDCVALITEPRADGCEPARAHPRRRPARHGLHGQRAASARGSCGPGASTASSPTRSTASRPHSAASTPDRSPGRRRCTPASAPSASPPSSGGGS